MRRRTWSFVREIQKGLGTHIRASSGVFKFLFVRFYFCFPHSLVNLLGLPGFSSSIPRFSLPPPGSLEYILFDSFSCLLVALLRKYIACNNRKKHHEALFGSHCAAKHSLCRGQRKDRVRSAVSMHEAHARDRRIFVAGTCSPGPTVAGHLVGVGLPRPEHLHAYSWAAPGTVIFSVGASLHLCNPTKPSSCKR